MTSRQSHSHQSIGPITGYLMEDHRRLEGLLESALNSTGQVEPEHYDRFRRGLLRHIGIEEKILLPAAHRLRGGEPLSIAVRLRLDHGAIAALLMPTPTSGLVAVLRSILAKHNLIEEGPDALYDICDRLASAEIDQLMAQFRAARDVAVLPHSDSPAVRRTVSRALERAGHEALIPLLPT